MMVANDISMMESALAARGQTVKSLCDGAGINQSTWTRWKSGESVPNMATWQRVRDAYMAATPPNPQPDAAQVTQPMGQEDAA